MNPPLWPSGVKPQACDGCPYVKRGRGFVAGHGSPTARLCIVGEAPGNHELGNCECTNHPKGEPFVGPSGAMLNNAIGGRADVFITNVRKCIPPEKEHRKEQEASIAHCTEAYLSKEFEAFGAEWRHILTVGGEALEALTGQYRIGRLHASVWTREEVEALRGAPPTTEPPPFTGAFASLIDESEEEGEDDDGE